MSKQSQPPGKKMAPLSVRHAALKDQRLASGKRDEDKGLAASEALLRLIADTMPVPISYVDKGGRYRFNNHANKPGGKINLGGKA